MDENLEPLGYLVSIHTPNMAKNGNKNLVGSAKQEFGSYLSDGAS